MERSMVSALGLIVILAGCAPTSPPLQSAAPPTIPASWKVQSADKYGISIAYPPGWKPGSGKVMDPTEMLAGQGVDVPPTQTGNAAVDREMQNLNEQAREDEAKEMAKLEAKGIIIRVNDLNQKPIVGEDPTRFQVVVLRNPSSSLADAAKTELEHVPGEEAPKPYTLPIGPAMVIHANKKMMDGADEYCARYIVQDGKTMIVVRFLTEGTATEIQNVEKQIMDSLRVVPGKAIPPPDAGS